MPPHFYVGYEDVLDLNLSLLRRASRTAGGQRSLRPVLAVALLGFLAKPGVADLVARRYFHEGVRTIDLRPSPLGDDGDGLRKIRALLAVLSAFRNAGLNVVLGSQGLLGETALTLGLANGFTVGLGYREKFNHNAALRSQRQQREVGDGGGPITGVYVSAAAISLPPKVAVALYADPGIRTQLRCPLGRCADRLDGPAHDPRSHYLHRRAADVADVLAQPERWRPNLVHGRLVSAMDLREKINKHMPAGHTELKTTALRHLVAEVDARLQAAA